MMTKPEKTKAEIRLDKCSFAKEFTPDDNEGLVKLFDNEIFQKLMGALLRESDSKGVLMLQSPLFTEEQVRKAIVMQGTARGYALAVDFILDLIDLADKEPEGDINNG